MSVKVSIVIPLYNKEEYIERVLKCIENQSLEDWECIIIDDGSTDNSARIVKNYISNRGNKWKYFHQENRGQAAARNIGIDLSTGEYIAFLDADDLWPSNKLLLQYSALESNKSYVLALSPFVIFESNSNFPRLVAHSNAKKMLSGWLSMTGFGGGLESVGLIRKSALGTNLRFDSSLTTSSGLDLALKLSDLGGICLLKEIGLLYRINDGQWHSNMGELERNLVIIRNIHEKRSKNSLEPSHFAYIYWANIRLNGWRNFFKAILKSIFYTENFRLQMIVSLVRRNLIARILGFINLIHIRKLLAKID